MSQHYKLDRVRELAEDDEDFVSAIAAAFIEEVPEDAERLKVGVPNKDFKDVYQAAHKMKPTIDMFELGVLDTLIEVQDWGKFEQGDKDVTAELQIVLKAVENATNEIKADFGL
ncbi:Hpt domain-containing protein [Winogradskyella undariae]|uniref:Hpt domain-containing protein n=1 Tax=Winogradskyella TaxID=286104 RepID=UPI00156BAAF8|nr:MULTISPECIES: Hpt domain-containing protein [Winogradskyella]NRR91946.1 Hpt domain-containing protein [Winogradskyella undariae]QNK78819.1 Hpt domain-containing protein [Winogradskyella sp. PAMC22761]QXP78148.1 Hpt domain-containing protein [Winogradskyella sp. HaHa_3_26]